tara:strand:+ start:1031 stop:1435 length:405 start_codon:yes stop_codon:yes gene_type:complete
MESLTHIYCLNKRHSKIVKDFLSELEAIINEATYYDDDFAGYQEIIKNFITFHNELGLYAIMGEVDYENWYKSLPNNVYWASMGYFAAVQSEEHEDVGIYKLKVLSLISETLVKLDRSLIAQSWTESEEKKHLN